MSNTSDVSQLKSNMTVCLLTLTGERVMRLDFGTPWHLIDYTKPEEHLKNDIRMMIGKSLYKNVRGVQINNIDVLLDPTSNNNFFAKIEIKFVNPFDVSSEETLSVGTTVGYYVFCR